MSAGVLVAVGIGLYLILARRAERMNVGLIPFLWFFAMVGIFGYALYKAFRS